MNYFENYEYFGMHFIWWILWILFFIWIFATPYNIPGQRMKKDTPLDLLKKRFASGEIKTQEYEDKKKILEG